MKSIIPSFILATLSLCLPLRAEITLKSDDLQIECLFAGEAFPLPSFDGSINCRIMDLNTNRTGMIVYEPEASYLYRAELFDSNDIAIPKTALGLQVGSHFGDLDSEVSVKTSHVEFNSSKNYGSRTFFLYLGKDIETTRRKMHYTTGDAGVAVLSKQASPKDLFQVNHAGEYKLRLSIQVFALAASKPASVKLVRFPVSEVKIVVKPEDIKAAKNGTVLQSPTPLRQNTPAVLSHKTNSDTLPRVLSSTTINKDFPAKSLTFAGYGSPESVFETWFWAYCRSDKTNMLQAFPTNQELESFESGALKYASYTLQKKEFVSDTEAILSYTGFGDSRVHQLLTKKTGNEWKVVGLIEEYSGPVQASKPAIRIK